MRTFAELLREYVARTGVSDAELARAVGVQRQTIFRWKEGLVARPRSVEDVLHLAAKLRLSEGERDELLLAAGFPPVRPLSRDERGARADVVPPPHPSTPLRSAQDAFSSGGSAQDALSSGGSAQDALSSGGSAQDAFSSGGSAQDAFSSGGSAQDAFSSESADGAAPATEEHPERSPEGTKSKDAGRPRAQARRMALIAAIVLIVAGAAVTAVIRGLTTRLPQARKGETLVLVAQFANFTRGGEGYNVAGRIREALERELQAAGLRDTRAVEWPRTITDLDAARVALRHSGAALIIWGEYDSGRAVARFTTGGALGGAGAQRLERQAATPDELPSVINSGLPDDARYLALYTLAQLYLADGEPHRAQAALGQASLNLPVTPGARAAHYFLTAYAHQIANPPDLDAAIDGYGRAVDLDKGLDAAYNNRGLAYLRRRGPGDLENAVVDLTRYLAKYSDDAQVLNNRGTAYFLLAGADNTALASADFDRAIALAPADPAAYYNRGLLHVRRNATEKWQADFGKALELAPQHAGAIEGLCWGYALSDEPARAVDYCRQALAAGGASAGENLGVALARTGEIAQARSALETYREELLQATGDNEAKIKQLDGWIEALTAGRNPFDAAALAQLREE